MPNFIRKLIGKLTGGSKEKSPTLQIGGGGGGASFGTGVANSALDLAAAPMNVVDQFCDDPIEFMSNHIVLTPGGTAYAGANKDPAINLDLDVGGLKFFTLSVERNTAAIADRPGVRSQVYRAHPSSSGGRGLFETYWCPYADNAMKTVTVSNSANFLFTAPMDGCSFGVGSATSNGSRLVGHSNQKGQPGQAKLQNRELKAGGMAEALVNPKVYMNIRANEPIGVTTFGIRNPQTKEWSFFYQIFTTADGGVSGSRTLIGIFPV